MKMVHSQLHRKAIFLAMLQVAHSTFQIQLFKKWPKPEELEYSLFLNTRTLDRAGDPTRGSGFLRVSFSQMERFLGAFLFGEGSVSKSSTMIDCYNRSIVHRSGCIGVANMLCVLFERLAEG